MRTFFKISEHTVFVTLIILSLLNYFFPLLYLQDQEVAEFGIPFAFYKVYLAPFPPNIPAEHASVFSGFGLLGDILFAYAVGCFAIFVEKKFKEGGSSLFRWILRVALFLAALLFILRIFMRGF